MADLGALIVRIETDLASLKSGMAQADKIINVTADKMGRNTARIGKQMTLIGAAITGVTVLFTKRAADFEEGIADVITLVDDFDGAISKRFSKGVLKISKDFGLAKSSLTKSLFDIQSATGDTTKAISTLNDASRLAVGGNSDLEASTSGLLTLMESYGDVLKSTADGADLLFKAQEKARATIGQLAQSSGKFLPIAAKLGVNVNELFSVFSQMTVALGNVEESATGMSATLNQLLKPTDALKAIYKEWGVASGEVAIEQFGLIGVLEKLNNLTSEELAQAIPNIRALKGLLGVIGDLNKVRENSIDIKNREGAVDDALAKKLATFNVKFKQFKETLDNVVISIGTTLLPHLIDLLESLKPVLDKIEQWTRENPALTGAIFKFTSALGALFLVLGPIIVVLGSLVTLAPAIVTAFTIIAGAVSGPVLVGIYALVAAVIVFKDEIATMADFVKTSFQNAFIEAQRGITKLRLLFGGDPFAEARAGLSAETPEEAATRTGKEGAADAAFSPDQEIEVTATRLAVQESFFEQMNELWDANSQRQAESLEADALLYDEILAGRVSATQDAATKEVAIWGANNDAKIGFLQMYNELVINSQFNALKLLTNVTKTFVAGVSAAFKSFINGTKTLGEAVKDLGKQMIGTVVDYVTQLILSWALQKVLASTAAAVQIATASVTAAAVAAAWAPAAALVSLATAGANAAPAAAGISFVSGLSATLASAKVPALADGGIVNRPTLALIGEAGPERITPLDDENSGGNVFNITINGSANTADDMDLLAERLGEQIEEEMRQV